MIALIGIGAPALVAVAAESIAVGLFGWIVLTHPRSNKQVMANLRRGLKATDPTETGPEPRESGLQAFARWATPARTVRTIHRLHARAGYPAAWSVPRLVAAKIALAAMAASLAVLYLASGAGALAVLLGVTVTVVAYFVPELLLHSRAQERSQQIALELADTLDQMTIAVEAGLGFDAAMAKAGRNGKGPLAGELMRTLQEIQVGHTRRDAYEGLARRTDVADLRRFVRAIIQADTYGIAVADVLRTQAAEMRLKRRQRAEEKAMQIPVKVIFPLMFCILPVLFIVLLGPAAMDIARAFS